MLHSFMQLIPKRTNVFWQASVNFHLVGTNHLVPPLGTKLPTHEL